MWFIYLSFFLSRSLFLSPTLSIQWNFQFYTSKTENLKVKILTLTGFYPCWYFSSLRWFNVIYSLNTFHLSFSFSFLPWFLISVFSLLEFLRLDPSDFSLHSVLNLQFRIHRETLLKLVTIVDDHFQPNSITLFSFLSNRHIHWLFPSTV